MSSSLVKGPIVSNSKAVTWKWLQELKNVKVILVNHVHNGLRFPSSNKFEIFAQRMFQSSFKRIWKIFFDLSHRQAWSYGWTERRTHATTLPLQPYGRGVNIVEVHVWKCTPWFTLCTRVRLFSYYVRVLMCTIILRRVWLCENLSPLHGVGGAVRFLRPRVHRVSSGWSSVWHRSNTGLSSTHKQRVLMHRH